MKLIHLAFISAFICSSAYSAPFLWNGISGPSEQKANLQILSSQIEKKMQKLGISLIDEQAKQALLAEKVGLEAGYYNSKKSLKQMQKSGIEKILVGQWLPSPEVSTLELQVIQVSTGLKENVAWIDLKDSSILKISDSKIEALILKLNLKNSDSSTSPSPQTKLKNIAILDSKGVGLSDAEVKSFTERFRSEVFHTKEWQVLERAQMSEILNEQAFQQSTCEGDACLQKAGQLLGSDFIIGSSVIRLRDQLAISARIIDVGTGQIVKTATLETQGDFKKLLKESSNDLSRLLADLPLENRIRTAGWVWGGISVLLASASAYSFYQASNEHTLYNQERSNIDQLLSHKEKSQNWFWVGGGLGTAALGAGGWSIWEFVRQDKKFEVKQNLKKTVQNGFETQMIARF